MTFCFQCLQDPAVPLGTERYSQAACSRCTARSVTVKAFAVLSLSVILCQRHNQE